VVDILEYPWVLKPVVEFDDKEHLAAIAKDRIIGPAEEKHRARQALLTELFNPVR
jgi:hypothetical protein